MKISDLNLYEGISSIVYHATNFKSAYHILTEDKIKSRAGHISFTRTLEGMYHKENRIIGVIFKVDGNKINQRYKGNPHGSENFDYDDEYDDPNEQFFSSKHNQQYEDTVKTKEIKNFSQYVTDCIIYIIPEYLVGGYDEWENSYEETMKYIASVIRLLEEHNISYRFNTSEHQFTKKVNDKEGFRKLLHKLHDDYDLGKENKEHFDIKSEYTVYYSITTDEDDMEAYEFHNHKFKMDDDINAIEYCYQFIEDLKIKYTGDDDLYFYLIKLEKNDGEFVEEF